MTTAHDHRPALRRTLVAVLVGAGVRSLREGEVARQFIEGHLDISFDDLGLDSLGVMELAIGLENEFGFSIRPDELQKFASADELSTALSSVIGP